MGGENYDPHICIYEYPTFQTSGYACNQDKNIAHFSFACVNKIYRDTAVKNNLPHNDMEVKFTFRETLTYFPPLYK